MVGSRRLFQFQTVSETLFTTFELVDVVVHEGLEPKPGSSERIPTYREDASSQVNIQYV